MGSFNPTSADLRGTSGLSKEKKAAAAKGKTKREQTSKPAAAVVGLTKEQILGKIADKTMTVEDGLIALSKVGQAGLYCKANPDKGGISLYGLQRMPITLYRNQWERLLPGCDKETHPVLMFIEANKQYLPETKGAKRETVPASLIGEGKPFRVPAVREEE